jgi:HK97 gp10 family phage protein
MARASIEIDAHAFQTGIGPSFMELRRDVEGYAKERAHRIADIYRVLAPRLKKQLDPRFYPGELADSIYVEEVGDKEFEVGARVRWAAFLEFGTSVMLAQPALRPAVAIVEAESI